MHRPLFAFRETRHSPVELEHRLTILEVGHDDHGKRITVLESKSPTWTPRDYVLAAAGAAVILAAAFGRVPWSLVLSLISGLR